MDRRSFLKALGGAAVGLAAAKALPSMPAAAEVAPVWGGISEGSPALIGPALSCFVDDGDGIYRNPMQAELSVLSQTGIFVGMKVDIFHGVTQKGTVESIISDRCIVVRSQSDFFCGVWDNKTVEILNA